MKWEKALGQSTLSAMFRLRYQRMKYDTYGEGSTKEAMLTFFGYPHQCLICDKPLDWENKAAGDINDPFNRDHIPDDIDPWFCMNHCPVCNSGEGEDYLNEKVVKVAKEEETNNG